MNNPTLGEKLKKARNAAGFTQKEIAKYLGMAVKDVSAWENNLERPYYRYLWHLSTKYNIDFETLVDEQYRREMEEYIQNTDIKNRRVAIVAWVGVTAFCFILIYAISTVIIFINPLFQLAVGVSLIGIFFNLIVIVLGIIGIIGALSFLYKIIMFIIKDKDINN